MNDLSRFPGTGQPSTDFWAVRSKLRTPPLYYDVDLSVARSIAAGTAQVLNLNGNSFFIDQKANTGYASVHFIADDNSSVPITVFPGFIARVPFIGLMIENVAQAGATLRIIYGVDMDFVPTTGAGVTVNAALTVADSIQSTCQKGLTGGAVAVGTTVTNVIPIGSNPRGMTIRELNTTVQAGAGGTTSMEVVAAAVAPVGLYTTQANSCQLMYDTTTVSASGQTARSGFVSRQIPAGWGIWIVVGVAAVAAAQNSLFWSLEINP